MSTKKTALSFLRKEKARKLNYWRGFKVGVGLLLIIEVLLSLAIQTILKLSM